MARVFDVPPFYRSQLIGKLKGFRAARDPHRKDLSPSILDFGNIELSIARHFGFCFGVENAIEIAYRAIAEHPGKRIFLVSEIIHNPEVNTDLRSHGVSFLMNTSGQQLIPFSQLEPSDIVIVPAFGTTVAILDALKNQGIDPLTYDTTCPFVKRVWKKAAELGQQGFSVILHGKRNHEETRATFSHATKNARTLVVRDLRDARLVSEFILGKISASVFHEHFFEAYSPGFDPIKDLVKVGVVNQTTMLASDTQEIALVIKQALATRYGPLGLREHFADTRDTLCYATNENQQATKRMIEEGADLALVVGGYNSSNTSHLAELCQEKMPTFYIKDAGEILNAKEICHYDLQKKRVITSSQWLPSSLASRCFAGAVTSHAPTIHDTEVIVQDPVVVSSTTKPVRVAITAGASCPDSTVDHVLSKFIGLLPCPVSLENALRSFFEGDSPRSSAPAKTVAMKARVEKSGWS